MGYFHNQRKRGLWGEYLSPSNHQLNVKQRLANTADRRTKSDIVLTAGSSR